MSKLPWKAWHQVVQVRSDLKSGELTMAMFAADLYDVMMGSAKPIYQKPAEFFALTYPTHNLRELAKDVAFRLAGKSDKAVRQLELTYGGGKTHTLITLLHLFADPDELPSLQAVQEFKSHISIPIPKARVVALPFDKIDLEKGMEVKGLKGKKRWLKHPWSILAWQIADSDGLKILHPENKDAERDTPPAEPLLVELLRYPDKDGLATLVLLDEVLMFARGKVGADPTWQGKLEDFFQALTQAVVKAEHCGLIASLLATDPLKNDSLGKEIMKKLYDIFRRQKEEGVQPVGKEDVAEVLRRRFFTADSIKDREAFKTHVIEALKGVKDYDDQTKKDARNAEDRYLASYPFHPELTELFYAKWTQLESFQRTRGVLRTFALAIRDAYTWDNSPLIGPNVFLQNPARKGISEAMAELTTVARSEEYEGKQQEWKGILEGELTKAAEVQRDLGSLDRCREIEQAVIATFLHSQPIGRYAQLRDLLLLLSPTRPDKIELDKGLRRWTQVSWFLDEAAMGSGGAPGELPKSWRLGSKPNLRQMHHEASGWVTAELVEAKLLEEVQKCKGLTQGAHAAGARVHILPKHTRDVDDEDGNLHYVILGPSAVSESGKPSGEARKYIEEKTGPEAPRVARNAVVVATPSKDGLEAGRAAIRDWLGWEEVKGQLQSQIKDGSIDPIRHETLLAQTEGARKRIPDLIQQAYSIVVTLSDKNEVQAFRLKLDGSPLFTQIKMDERARIQETAITAEALLPEGPYALWKAGETHRYVRDLVNAFERYPHLPKMLNMKAIQETIQAGCKEGRFVLRGQRPDKSIRTWWRDHCDDEEFKRNTTLELVLPEAAELSDMAASLVAPSSFKELWPSHAIKLADVESFFDGKHTVTLKSEPYPDTILVPKAPKEAVNAAISAAVKEGKVWLVSGSASVLAEEVPPSLLGPATQLRTPPPPLSPGDLLPQTLPAAWSEPITTAAALSSAVSQKNGIPLPWLTVREALDAAFRTRMLERSIDSGPWPCDAGGSSNVKVKVPAPQPGGGKPTPQPTPVPQPGVFVAESELKVGELQDLSDAVSELAKAAVGMDLKFKVRIELNSKGAEAKKTVEKMNAILGDVSPNLHFPE